MPDPSKFFRTHFILLSHPLETNEKSIKFFAESFKCFWISNRFLDKSFENQWQNQFNTWSDSSKLWQSIKFCIKTLRSQWKINYILCQALEFCFGYQFYSLPNPVEINLKSIEFLARSLLHSRQEAATASQARQEAGPQVSKLIKIKVFKSHPRRSWSKTWFFYSTKSSFESAGQLPASSWLIQSPD